MILIGIHFVNDNFWVMLLYLSDLQLEVAGHTAREILRRYLVEMTR